MTNTFEAPLTKSGNAFIVKIPSHIIESAHLRLNELIICSIENHRLTIQPKPMKYSLAELLADTTETEPEMDWGKPMGAETW